MARTKEFDESEVLGRAMEVFWHRGYAQTSFSDLVKALGVSRQSLYDTYGDKQALFRASLTRYVDQACNMVQRKLDRPGSIREIMTEVLDSLAEGACEGESAGCFMVNSMVELTPLDPSTRALAERYARNVEGAIASRLSAAQRKGEIGRSLDPVLLARFFFQTILGIGVAARAYGDRENIQRATRLALKVLE
jgi:TetR/AcrR family transcriptional repressor of nem operon